MRPALALCLSTWLPRRQPTIATSQLGTLLHQARSVSRGITCVLPCRLKPKRDDGVSKLAFFDKGVKQTYSQAESKEAGIDLSKCVCPCLPPVAGIIALTLPLMPGMQRRIWSTKLQHPTCTHW